MPPHTPIEVLITKYALTQGVFRAEAERVSDKMIRVGEGGFNNYFYLNDWHLTWADALKDCERRREAKIKSLEKQLANLKSKSFASAKPWGKR